MLFLNTALLAGLLAVAVPIILHLLNRRTAKVLDWGAMRFLLDSLQARKKRIQLEEALLMACRCLLVALVALAVARPFVPPGSQVPWIVVLPCFLLGITMAAVTTVMWEEKPLRWKLLGITIGLFLIALGSIVAEKWLNLSRFGSKGRRDIALVIDGSMSMTLKNGNSTNFDLALKEAEKIITEAGSGTAFSLILGAPVPQLRIPEPIVNRNDLREALGTLRPVNGKMAAFDTLFQAVKSLSLGHNPAKQIIVLTDAQDIGWDMDKSGRWQTLGEGLKQLKNKPELVIRQFPLPTSVRNVAISQLRYSRDIIGTDRPVTIEVSVTNTGSEAVTPASVELTIGDKALSDSSLGQLLPGTSETVRFQHRFTHPGTAILQAHVTVEDDIAPDNTWDAVAEIKQKVRVLIVDGSSGRSFLERSSAFAALALAPGSLLKSTVQTDNTEQSKDLVDPEVKSLSQLAALESFAPWDVVILCDVPALSPNTARGLAGFVEAGGGLLIAPGARSTTAFYNDWRSPNGQPISPLKLIEATVIPDSKEAAKASLSTFTHPALKLVADAKQSDLSSLVVRRYWKLEDSTNDAAVSLGGRLATGDPFFASRTLGQGLIVQLCSMLDATDSNFASRHAFVPFMHEIVYHLASPGGQRFNLPPAFSINVPLSLNRATGGLRGEYFANPSAPDPAFSRIDPVIDFKWGENSPAPGLPDNEFRIRWTGSVVPRYSEDYHFRCDADDRAEVWINGEIVTGDRRKRDKIPLQANVPAEIRVDFIEEDRNATMRLFWQSQSQRYEVIPQSCLQPFAISDQKEGSDIVAGALDAIGPDQLPRSLQLVYQRFGSVARLQDNAIPGLYQITIPEAKRLEFAGLLTADSKLPFTIIGDASEGQIKPLDDKAFAFIEQHFALLRPKSTDDTLAILAGKQFGEELWKYLAMAALFLLLGEIALSRWIAVQRQSEAGDDIVFEDRHKVKPAFAEALERLQKTS